jgi:putative transposase
MSSPVSFLAVVHCLRPLSLVVDLIRLVALAARPRAALVAENLFLRKQLSLFQERKVALVQIERSDDFGRDRCVDPKY